MRRHVLALVFELAQFSSLQRVLLWGALLSLLVRIFLRQSGAGAG